MKLWQDTSPVGFLEACHLDGSRDEQVGLYKALHPLRISLDVKHKEFFADVIAKTGAHWTSAMFENLAKRQVKDERFAALALYLYQTYPEFCISHTGLAGEQAHEEVYGKKLWDIAAGLPEPIGEDARKYIASVRADLGKDRPSDVKVQDVKSVSYRSWHLVPHKKKYVNRNTNNFNLDVMGQTSRVGEPLEVYFDITSEPEFAAADYGFGFRCIQIRTSLVSNVDCEISYSLAYQEPREFGQNAVVEFSGGRTSGKMKITSRSEKPLSETVRCYEDPFFSLRPHDDHFKFSAEMWANLRDGSLVRADGTPLPSREKEVVILSLLAKAIVGNRANNGEYTLCRQNFRIEPREIKTSLDE